MRRTKNCPGCGPVEKPCQQCPYLDGKPDKLSDWRPLRWPRKLTAAELDAYGHGYHQGWKRGYADRGAADE
jgi:hypothetical protein